MPAHDKPIPSKVAYRKHPLHPMAVVFPTAFLIATPAADLAFWWRQDAFWAQAAFWLTSAGFLSGVLAALLGLAEFLLLKPVRRHVAGWTHLLTALTALSLAGTGMQLRWEDPIGTVLPWGFSVSVLTALMIGVAGWLGGTLTFGHGIGTYVHDSEVAASEAPGTEIIE